MTIANGFQLAADAVDPRKVPYVTLNTGAKMPVVGLGTFGSDHVPPEKVAEAVKEAIALGYRHIDCASVYGNEKEIGSALKEVLDSGLVRREELFITSKVWNDMHGDGAVIASCAKSLQDLGLDYVDLYLVHWPFPNYHPPFCDVDSRSPDSRPFYIEDFMGVWRQMEKLYKMGLAKAIGTSNVTIPKFKEILKACSVKPACNEMELHPHFQQRELMNFVLDNGMVPIGFSPIGSPQRPARDTTPEDTVDTADPVIVEIAQAHGVHPAVICVKWAAQNGQVPIPFSTTRRNYRSNLLSVTEDPLTAEEMERISKIDKNCRLIKGQVFLWEGAESWRNLWDEAGEIDRTGWKGE